MFNQDYNNRGRQLACEGLDDRLVHRWHCRVLETSRHNAQDCENVVLGLAMMSVDQPTDHGVKQDDKSGPKCGDEEECLSSIGHPSCCEIASTPYEVQHSQSRQPHRGIDLSMLKILQSINDDFVSGSPIVDVGDAHQCGYLTDCNIQGRTSHISGNSSQRDEVNDPAAANESDEADDGSSNDRKRRCYNMTWVLGIALVYCKNDVACDGRHDGDRLGKVSDISCTRLGIIHLLRW